MKHDPRRLAIKVAAFVATLIASLTVLAAPLMAQRDRDRDTINNNSLGLLTPTERLEAKRARQGTVPLDQEMQLRGLPASQERRTPDNFLLRAIVAQIMHDFDRIQIINVEIKRAVTANTGFDYKNLKEMTSEIRKRAKRLKGAINLPPPDAGQASQLQRLEQTTDEEMKGALVMLHNRIISFVTNPLFQTPNWLDIKLAARASRDLETIIEQSGKDRRRGL